MSDAFEEPKICRLPRPVLEKLFTSIKDWVVIAAQLRPKKYDVVRVGDEIKVFDGDRLVAKTSLRYLDDANAVLTIVRSEELLKAVLEALLKLQGDVGELLRIYDWLCV